MSSDLPSCVIGSNWKSVPSYAKAELDKESRAIDTENLTAERMASQLDRLGRELELIKADLDRTSQYEVDDFNRKVSAYNSLLERVRGQNRRVNQLVDSYNEKLRSSGQ
ncbi:hypothetical protein OAK98_04375 [Mariniblastus sp.]|nr:hypothetical protein [Mariniblastus sp.]